MNATELIKALRPLKGNRILALALDGNWEMDCHDVMHLPRDERVDVEVGNVILFKGSRDEQGCPEGLVFWARGVEKVEHWPTELVLVGRNGGRGCIIIEGPIESRGQL